MLLTLSYDACVVFVALLCFMGSSLAASAEARLDFAMGGSAYVCLGCEEAFLRQGPCAERWQTVFKSGIVWDRAARDFERRVEVRKCSCAAGEDTNGDSLDYCHPFYKVVQPTTSKRASLYSSLLHSQVSSNLPATVIPGPKCLRLRWGTCETEREACLPWRQRHNVLHVRVPCGAARCDPCGCRYSAVCTTCSNSCRKISVGERLTDHS